MDVLNELTQVALALEVELTRARLVEGPRDARGDGVEAGELGRVDPVCPSIRGYPAIVHLTGYEPDASAIDHEALTVVGHRRHEAGSKCRGVCVKK